MSTLSPEVTKAAQLNEQQVAEFHREGYLIHPHPVFPQARFDKLKDHFEQILAALPPGSRPEAMNMPHLADTALFEWLFANEVLDLVEPIIGPDIALFSSHFISKPKGDGRRVPWHEDSAYWKGLVEPMEIVTVWLAIDPSLKENGCMYVIPRTHREGRKGYSDYDPVDTAKHVFNREITKTQRDESRAVACELQPNHASLHDARIMHGSECNTSSLRRCGYTMRYMSSACRLAETRNGIPVRDLQLIYLARGRDLANQNYADPTKAQHGFLERRQALQAAGHTKNDH